MLESDTKGTKTSMVKMGRLCSKVKGDGWKALVIEDIINAKHGIHAMCNT